MVDTTHVFNVTKGSRTYQVIDNEEGSLHLSHRYTVLEWDRRGFDNGGRLIASDGSIYATSKLEAVNKYVEKLKRQNELDKGRK